MSIRIAALGLTAALGMLIVTNASPAAAQGRGTAQQRNACMGDAFRLCFTSIPNHRRIELCLKANRRSLTPECRREVFGHAPVRTFKKSIKPGAA